jgi:hypothetical protein
MSIELMAKVWKSKYEGTELLIYLSLADSANDEGICWPSVETISRKCKVTPRHVTRVISKLETEGAVKRKPRRGTTNLYQVLAPLTPESPPPDSHVTPPLTRESPRTIIEPSINHKDAVTGKTPEPPITENTALPVRFYDPDEPDSITKDKKGKRRLSHECPDNWPVMKALRAAAHAGPGEDDARIGREAKLIRKCEPNWSPDEIARFIIAQFVVKSGYWFSAPHAFGKRVDYYPMVTQVRQHWTKAKEWLRRKPVQPKPYEEA